ncbi:MAG: MFS transporter [Bacteroidota bacterium]
MSEEPKLNRRTVFGWAMYDFANSAFTTLVVTFIYATYFTEAIAEDSNTGTFYWSLAVGISAILVAVVSPYAGAIADQGGYRKRFLLLSTILGVAATIVLFFPLPGQIYFALITFVIGNFAFEIGLVFYNAFLPELAPQEKIGRVSGFAWGLGYLGGLLCLVIALVTVVMPEEPMFGLSKENGEYIRATNLLVAAWYAIFSIPLFIMVKEEKQEKLAFSRELFSKATAQFVNTFQEIRNYRDIFRMLIARIFYNDGLVTIIAFGAIYAVGTFGFSTQDTLIFGIVLNVSAGLGAIGFGYLDDKLGGKTTIQITNIGLIAASLLAVFAQSAAGFWVAGVVVGLLMGPNQSASRSLMGRFIPADKENEFYGFFAFSGKATSFIGPILLGQITLLFDSQRAGVSVVILLFIVGMIILHGVNEKEGMAAAGRGSI